MSAQPDTDAFYTVRAGDTLTSIARSHGTTVSELARVNGITNPNHLRAGQKLHLTAASALAVRPLFLDAARNPIRGMRYRLDSKGVPSVTGTTQPNGLGAPIVTQTPTDTVSIWVQRAWGEQTWKQIAQVTSDVGEKLVTLISPKLKIQAPLHPHPKDHLGQPVPEASVEPPSITQRPPGTPRKAVGTPQSMVTPDGDSPGIRSRTVTDKNGVSREVLSQDYPNLQDYFKLYTGEKITDSDYQKAADTIECEVNVIKALAQVEAGGGGFDHLKRPKILYERHIFSRHTKGKFDSKNAEISSPHAYTTHKVGKHGQLISASDRYNGGQKGDDISWDRFQKAYHYDKDAAIMACSWGMFQILGENYKACQIDTPESFMEYACTSEQSQFMHLFVPYAMSRRDKHGMLKKALVTKDWSRIAFLYNGPDYEEYSYDARLKNAYEGLKHA